VATRNRAASLVRTLESLRAQEILPAELIVIDGSSDAASRYALEAITAEWPACCAVTWQPAQRLGAAVQRNQGVALAQAPFVWFFDDDIVFQSECVVRLWEAMSSNPSVGGVGATIVNQRYQAPGAVSRTLFSLLHGRREASYAGRVIGPAVNLLPEDREDLPELVPVEWLNTTCTIYRRSALPTPPFDSVFTGYSLMEDVTLSLRVGREWKLMNARTARVFHDSQPGEHKSSVSALAEMELVNRHYVMTEVLGRTGIADHCRLVLWEAFQLAGCALGARSRPTLPAVCRGKVSGLGKIRRRVLATC
jgi:glycosyltransferase involved in cell wall biosynthesis